MKKYLVSALAIALLGASIAGIAQSAPAGHFHPGMQGMMGMDYSEMQAMRDGMQKKMSAAKTDEERQALMAEQQKVMLEKRKQIASSNGEEHCMSGMASNMAERQQMMHQQMGSGMGMRMGMMPM